MSYSRCSRPQEKSNSIECNVSSLQTSFLLSSSCSCESIDNDYHPTLFTFPADARFKQILSQGDFLSLAAKYSSAPTLDTNPKDPHFELDGKILDENLQFSSFSLKDLILVINENISLRFHSSKEITPNLEILNEHLKQIVFRLPIDNGTRPTTDGYHRYPNESLDLLFDTLHGQSSYLTTYLKSHFGAKHEFTIYPIQKGSKQWNEWETGIYRMRGDKDGTVNIALASDWGAGTLEAALVASAMVNGLDLINPQKEATSDLPHYTIHLGDIYYVGLPSEVRHCCLGIKPHWAERGVRWPIGQYGSFAIPGNHELYSRGFGYWDCFLPHLGLFNSNDLQSPVHPQTTSYWLLENDQWRIIGLDTGYDSYSLLFIDDTSIKLPEQIMNWLRNVVGLNRNMTDKRGLIFFTHHQLLSAWNEKPNTDFPEQIASLLPEGRTVLFLWGHEHRLSFYEKQTVKYNEKNLTFYGRCVGNSGFPTLAKELPVRARQTKLLIYDDRLYQIHDNPFSNDLALGFNGYVTMKFINTNKPTETSLYLCYKSLNLNENRELTEKNPLNLVNEEWSVDSQGNVVLVKLEAVNRELTIGSNINTTEHHSIFGSNGFNCCITL